MSEVKWIKITTDMFEDEKIDFIQSLPESDSMIIIWVRLLTLAGKCNHNGYIYLTENIPYTDDMLAHKFKKPLNIVRLALQTFERLDMIEVTDKGLLLTNWSKHQNIDGLEKIRLQTKERVAKFRDKQKQLTDGNVTSNATVTDGNETEEEVDIEKEIDIKIIEKTSTKIKEAKVHYAERVTMTEIEYNKLLQMYSKDIIDNKIIDLDLWKGSKGKSTKSDYLTIMSWLRKDKPVEVKTKKSNRTPIARRDDF